MWSFKTIHCVFQVKYLYFKGTHFIWLPVELNLNVLRYFGWNTLLSVPDRFKNGFSGIISLFLHILSWNFHRLSEIFAYTMVPNFIEIGSQIKNFPIYLYSKLRQYFVHRRHCKNPLDFYNWRLWANSLFVDRFWWNLAPYHMRKFQIICENFSSKCWEIKKLSLKIHFQTYLEQTIVNISLYLESLKNTGKNVLILTKCSPT